MSSSSLIRKLTATSVINRMWIRSCAFTTNGLSPLNHDGTVNSEVVDDDSPIALETNPFEGEKPKCILCKYNIEPDYKNVRLLSQFQSRFTGKIYERHITGLCEEKQKKVEEEIRKAQTIGLMGIYTKNPKYIKDPKLFDPNNPFRPHSYA